MTDCRKCKHCVYTAHDFCGSGNKLISCDSKFEAQPNRPKNCKNYEVKNNDRQRKANSRNGKRITLCNE